MAESGRKASQKASAPPDGQKSPGRKILSMAGKVFAAMICVCVITGSIVAAVLAIYIFRSLDGTVDIDLTQLPLNYTTIMYATDKETGEDYELLRLESSENRIWVDIDQMPDHLLEATIAVEDKRFLSHHGVDWRRTFAAFINEFIVPIFPGTQGGSTITQQVIKNVTNEWEVSVKRKVNEIFNALKLEKQFSKEEILESYLNTINFGYNIHGVQAAANFYFDKDVSELTLPEAACIITITNAPSYYNPYGEKGMQNNKERRNYIYSEMLDLGYLTQEEYDEVYDSDVQVVRTTSGSSSDTTQSWFEDHVINEVLADLEEAGYSSSEAWDMLYNRGLRIYTTLDKTVQDSLEASYADPNTFPPVYNTEYPESAVVVLNAEDGSIAGLIGGNTKEGDRLFNRATMARRHPGSTIKPISAYLQAFEMDLVTWSTMFANEPISIYDYSTGEFIDWPVNFDGSSGGTLPLVQAVQRSINVVPAQLMEIIGPEQSFYFLRDKLGMHSLVSPEEASEHNGQHDMLMSPMTLGGMAEGVTPLEMAGAYTIFVNGGKFVEPYCYTHVYDSDGNLLLEKDTKQVRVISEETSTIINKLLQMVVQAAPGTGTTANLAPMPTAGKTGTSSEDYDQWFIGMTPYYVCAVWMGYDQQARIQYASYPPPILWKRLMTPIHENLPIKNFEVYGDVQQLAYCTVSGELATENCPDVAYGWYKSSFIPSNCTYHLSGGTNTSTSLDDEEWEESGEFSDEGSVSFSDEIGSSDEEDYIF